MEKESKAKFQVTNNFNCPIGQYIANIEHQEVHFDKDMQPVFANEMQKPTREFADQQPATSVCDQQPTAQYSSYLKRGAKPLKSDDEVQRNFVNAAKSGPSALVDYLLTTEGRLYFDVFDIKPSVFIDTVNKECGTNIAVKSYETAKYRKVH